MLLLLAYQPHRRSALVTQTALFATYLRRTAPMKSACVRAARSGRTTTRFPSRRTSLERKSSGSLGEKPSKFANLSNENVILGSSRRLKKPQSDRKKQQSQASRKNLRSSRTAKKNLSQSPPRQADIDHVSPQSRNSSACRLVCHNYGTEYYGVVHAPPHMKTPSIPCFIAARRNIVSRTASDSRICQSAVTHGWYSCLHSEPWPPYHRNP